MILRDRPLLEGCNIYPRARLICREDNTQGIIPLFSKRLVFEKYVSYIMYLLTKWEGRMGKYLARGHGVRTERSKVRAR